MQYYLDTYLNGMDQFKAYEYFGMDPVIYVSPIPIFDEKDLKNWRHTRKILSVKDGETSFLDLYETPEGKRQRCVQPFYHLGHGGHDQNRERFRTF